MARRLFTPLALLAVIAAVALVAPGAARSDGDPASDYLLGSDVFLPFDLKIDEADTAALKGLLANAAKKGLELKVAVIGTRYDLGAVPSLFGKPQTYAHFLAQELFYYMKRELIVVMPNGYGLYSVKGVPAADKAAIEKLTPPGDAEGATLVRAASDAVRAVAAAHGLTLSVDATGGAGSHTMRDRLLIAGGALLAAALAVSGTLIRRRLKRRDA
ncbi:MAG: hypothetical protein F2663_01120 [Actinobacteria bacterium]|nr:hypothetical protein [Actinomycetota bacterium]